MTKFFPGQILFAIPAICSEHTVPKVVFYMGRNERGQTVVEYNDMRLTLPTSDVFPLSDDAKWEIKRRLATMEADIEVTFDMAVAE